jgi:signal transduction histidine kinase
VTAAGPGGSGADLDPARIAEILDLLSSLARLDFGRRARILGEGPLDAIAASVNMLAEELEAARSTLAEARATNAAGEQARARLEAQLRQAQKMQDLGRLAGGVAHDFNNMLTAILAHANLAREAARQPEVQADLDAIIAASGRAAGAASQVLAFSRGRAADASPIDLGALVGEVQRLLRPTLGVVDLVVRTPAEPVWTRGERYGMVQVVMNLCVNARQALDGPGRIEVAVMRAQVRGTCAACQQDFTAEMSEVQVSDQGRGVPEDVLPRIFEPFFTTRREAGGSGLGLSVVHGLVHGWGGHLLVESDGITTRFRVLLPAAQAPARAAAQGPSQPEAGGQGRRVLIVDDEPLVLASLARLLRRSGWEVHVEEGGAAALRRAARGGIDVVLTDYAMPGMSGTELARALKDQHPGLPVVLVTGNPGEVPLDGEVVAVVAKPPDLPQLSALLASAVARSS